MAILNIYTGLESFSASDTVKNITIPSVNLGKTGAFRHVRLNGVDSGDMAAIGVGCNLTSSTNLQLNRTFALSTPLQVQWWVIETDSWIVQRGSTAINVTNFIQAITSVDESKAWSTNYMYGQSMPTMMDDGLVEDYINSPTQLIFRLSFPSVANIANWQVIEDPNCNVQKQRGTTTNATFDDYTVTAVDEAKTIIKGSLSKSSLNILPDQMRSMRINSPTNVRLSAYTAGVNQYAFYVIENPNWNIQKGFSATVGTTLVGIINAVDTAKTFSHLAGQYDSWQTTNNTAVNGRQFSWTNKLNSATEFQLDRNNALAISTTVSWQIWEFDAVVASVIPQISDYYRRLLEC